MAKLHLNPGGAHLFGCIYTSRLCVCCIFFLVSTPILSFLFVLCTYYLRTEKLYLAYMQVTLHVYLNNASDLKSTPSSYLLFLLSPSLRF